MIGLLPLLLSTALVADVPQQPVRRVAIIVGAKKAVRGRAPLRYSYDDAQSMASVLTDLGEFRPSDVITLEDPEPSKVLDSLDAQLAQLRATSGETLLLFYYSGHADEQALYPDGKALPYAEIRGRLDAPSATVRIGIIDACSGGGWTQSKGLHADEPFDVGAPLTLSSEGSVLIASSSGVEKARESESIGGSFFTHHFVAGLQGAADQNGDGRVTVTEAFAYARELTVRDSAINSEYPQHPSFAMNLRGRGELPLTYVAANGSTLVLSQQTGPMQLIQLDTGLIVLEAPAGPRTLRLAVAPGHYLIRRRGEFGTFIKDVTVEAGKTTTITEESLELVGRSSSRAKDYAPLDPSTHTVSWHHFTLSFGAGIASSSSPPASGGGTIGTTFTPWLSLYWQPTDRLEIGLPFPSIRYRFGDREHLELIAFLGTSKPYVGNTGEGQTVLTVPVEGSLTLRKWFGRYAVHASVWAWDDLVFAPSPQFAGQLGTGISLGATYASPGRWSGSFEIEATRNALNGGQWLTWANDSVNDMTLSVGSSRLVRFRLTDAWSAEAGAWIGETLQSHQLIESLDLGFSWSFL